MDAFIADAKRSARGKRKKGIFNNLHPMDLSAIMIRKIIERNGLDEKRVEDVILGCVSQVGEQDFNIARAAVLSAGLDISIPATTLSRLCGSAQQAINFAAMAVASGQHDLIIAGGIESMSRVPLSMKFPPPGEGLKKNWPNLVHQGLSAEMIADKYNMSREDLDVFSLRSQKAAAEATETGKFKEEIEAIEVTLEDGTKAIADVDEHFRPGTTLSGLASLAPAFKEDGKIHAGNSSGIVDGASTLLIANKKGLEDNNLKARARIVQTTVCGSDPVLMLTGPVPATKILLEKTGLSISDIDLFEINEAFAPVPMFTAMELEIPMEKINVNGGAIALGHPLGATGGMLITTLLHELERRKLRYGIATMCIGHGMGIATLIDLEV